jgi:hypothetical protein
MAGKLLRGREADAGLDRYFHVSAGKYAVQKSVQLLGICQQAGAPALGRHRAGRAAEIEIDLIKAHVPQHLRRGEERLGVVSQELRDEDQPGIFLRSEAS